MPLLSILNHPLLPSLSRYHTQPSPLLPSLNLYLSQPSIPHPYSASTILNHPTPTPSLSLYHTQPFPHPHPHSAYTILNHSPTHTLTQPLPFLPLIVCSSSATVTELQNKNVFLLSSFVQVEIRPMMYVALTYDHRLIDGREAVSFLRKIKSGVEDPHTLLLEL